MGVFYSQPKLEPCRIDPKIAFEKYGEGWYEIGASYWSRQEASMDGMLGGFPEISDYDINSSCNIIEKLKKERSLGSERCADIGAGIGRVSKYCLSKYFKAIDLIDPVEKFLRRAEKNLSDTDADIRTFACGAQDWKIEDKYDCFWVQWTLLFLKDDDAVKFLQRCKEHMQKKGYIIIKDNLATPKKKAPDDDAQFFPDDRSISRTLPQYYELFKRAGLHIVDESIEELSGELKQDVDLMPICIFVLH